MKRIGFNCLFLIPGEVGGTEYYTRDLISALFKYGAKKTEIVLFANKENYASLQNSYPQAKVILCPIFATNRIARILYEQLFFPFVVRQEKCDFLISPGYWGPTFSLCDHIVVAHDANWRDQPEDSSFFQRLIQEVLMQGSLSTAKKIIVDSDFGLKRLTKHFPHLSKKIHVLSPGVSEDFLEIMKESQPHPLDQKDYVFCPSAFYPHKKVLYLLELWQEYSQQNNNAHLVVVGRRGKDEKEVQQRMNQLQNCTYFSTLPLDKLVALYQHAQVVLFPSIYEGFGFPVYEGLAAQKSVVVGNKKLYSADVQAFLMEFTFELNQDIKLFEKALKAPRQKQPNLPHYREMIVSFENLIETL